MKRTRENTVIPRRPLLWLAAALLCLVPTMLGSLAIWVPLVFLAALLAKFWMEKKDRRLRSLIWKIVLAILAVGATIATYGSPTGLEPGVSLLVLLASLKILEAHTARDFHVLVMIGWVLCLAGFIMSQEFALALCVLTAFVLLVTALVQFHRGRAPGKVIRPPLITVGKILAQALPLVILLFLFFPRGTGGFRLQLPGAPTDSTGFSGKLSPGTVASIATSEELAFRAEFPDGKMPPRSSLYWRGAVLWQGGGLEWEAGTGLGRAQADMRPIGESIRQRITIEPHAGRWLFALDRPLAAPAGATLAPGRYLHTPRPNSRMRRYEVVSASDATEDELRPRERTAFLLLPPTISSEVHQLAQSWTAQNSGPRAVVKAALEFFRTQGFVYSVSPGQYEGATALDDFLFRRKIGFCEHYAGTFATLMRAAGIPSRVVVGYLGGQFNQFGNYLLVRQSEAHAWCEIWIPETGWERVDPTSVIAPERLSLGSLREMLASQTLAAATGAESSTGRTRDALRFFDNARLAWDSVSFAWDTRVLSFDLDAQREFLTQLRIDGWSGGAYLLWIAAIAAILLAVYASWTRWRARPRPDPLRALYDQFCLKAEALGAPRLASEGPANYARRAADLIPQKAEGIRRITENYIALRYSPRASSERFANFVADVRSFVRGPGRE
jgi:transglutaminase-like putative cysteine protease